MSCRGSQDPAVAALLIAKASQATERGVDLVVDPASDVPQLDDALAADVNTVMGNLIDNAFDAAAGGGAPACGWPWRTPREAGHRDGARQRAGRGLRRSARGLHPRLHAPRRPAAAQERGIGLAIVRVICRNRGGDIDVGNDDGAVFVATLPVLLGRRRS